MAEYYGLYSYKLLVPAIRQLEAVNIDLSRMQIPPEVIGLGKKGKNAIEQ